MGPGQQGAVAGRTGEGGGSGLSDTSLGKLFAAGSIATTLTSSAKGAEALSMMHRAVGGSAISLSCVDVNC
jgi:hypothetical protein